MCPQVRVLFLRSLTAPILTKDVDAVLDSCMKTGLIRYSELTWSSPSVIIPKKDGGNSINVVYERLNVRLLANNPFPASMSFSVALVKGR